MEQATGFNCAEVDQSYYTALGTLDAVATIGAYDAIGSPDANDGSTWRLSSAEPLKSSPIVLSLLAAGINDADASTRATVARRAGVPLIVGQVQEIWSRGDTHVVESLSRSYHRLLAIMRP